MPYWQFRAANCIEQFEAVSKLVAEFARIRQSTENAGFLRIQLHQKRVLKLLLVFSFCFLRSSAPAGLSPERRIVAKRWRRRFSRRSSATRFARPEEIIMHRLISGFRHFQ